MSKENKVVRVFLSGGIIGLLTTDPKKAIDKRLSKENTDGWSAVQILPHGTSNIAIAVLQLIVLLLTLLLWTWGAGYIVLLERVSEEDVS